MAMADQTPSKRPRDAETLVEDVEDPKRQKSYNHILSLLDEEEEEPTQDLSSLITTLQQELSSDSTFDLLNAFSNSETDQETNPTSSAESASNTTTFEGYVSSSSGSSSPSSHLKEGDERGDDSERVMRRLLEASDDELGIPQREVDGFDGLDGFNGLDGFSFGDGLWELEDEAANYYTLVQSELFM